MPSQDAPSEDEPGTSVLVVRHRRWRWSRGSRMDGPGRRRRRALQRRGQGRAAVARGRDAGRPSLRLRRRLGDAAGSPARRPTRIESATVAVDPSLIEHGPFGPLPRIGPDGRRPLFAYARPFNFEDARPKVAVLILGLGLRAELFEAALALPGPIGLQLSPYAPDLPALVERARRAGHEVLLDLPMEPADYPASDPGPHTLLGRQLARGEPEAPGLGVVARLGICRVGRRGRALCRQRAGRRGARRAGQARSRADRDRRRPARRRRRGGGSALRQRARTRSTRIPRRRRSTSRSAASKPRRWRAAAPLALRKTTRYRWSGCACGRPRSPTRAWSWRR